MHLSGPEDSDWNPAQGFAECRIKIRRPRVQISHPTPEAGGDSFSHLITALERLLSTSRSMGAAITMLSLYVTCQFLLTFLCGYCDVTGFCRYHYVIEILISFKNTFVMKKKYLK